MRSQDEAVVQPIKEYVIALDEMVGKAGRQLQMDAQTEAPFWIIAYDDVPENGSTTAFTFGVSSIHHSDWKHDLVEIVININSKDDDWILSLAVIASALRGKCPFSYGNILRFGKSLAENSKMTSYLIFWPTILEKNQQKIFATVD